MPNCLFLPCSNQQTLIQLCAFHIHKCTLTPELIEHPLVFGEGLVETKLA